MARVSPQQQGEDRTQSGTLTGRRSGSILIKRNLSKAKQLASEPSSMRLQVSAFRDRLHLERNMKSFALEAFNFLVIALLLLTNLFCEEPQDQMNAIRQNFVQQFNVEELGSVHTLEGIYKYLYNFLEETERFDPLNAERYIQHRHGREGAYTDFSAESASDTEDVTLIRERQFTAVTAMLIRPQVFMTRVRRVPCTGFARVYDKLYSMARHVRYKYDGSAISGGWQPQRVHFKKDRVSPALTVSERKPAEGSGGSKVSAPTDHMWGSHFLTCLDPEAVNSTMPRGMREQYMNVEVKIGGVSYFGDFYVEKLDILAYMGYNVFHVNATTNPHCFFSPRRDPVTWEVLERAVSLQDADERCERTYHRWIDGRTKRIRSQAFFYTPVVEVFTEVCVEFEILETGKLQPNFRIVSFQALRQTDRYKLWWYLTVAEIAFSLLQLLLIAVRIIHRRSETKKHPNLAEMRVTWREVMRNVFSIGLQTWYLGFCAYRLVSEHWGPDVWALFEGIMSRNPYAGPQAAEETMVLVDQILGYIAAGGVVKVWGFLLLCASFLQVIIFMSIHPRVGLLANTLLQILNDLVHFAVIFGILYTMLCAMGTWAFGSDIEQFSTLRSSLWVGFFWALGAFDSGQEEELPSESLVVLFHLWTVIFLVVIFVFLLNFLLAIVVDGYAAAKELTVSSIESNFLHDVLLLAWSQAHYHGLQWPRRAALLNYLQGLPEDQANVTCADLEGVFAGSDEMSPQLQAAWVVLFYGSAVPAMLASGPKAPGPEDSQSSSKEAGGAEGLAEEVRQIRQDMASLAAAVSGMSATVGQIHSVLEHAQQRRIARQAGSGKRAVQDPEPPSPHNGEGDGVAS